MAAALGYRPDGTAARLCFYLQQPSYDTDTLIEVLDQLARFYAGQRVVLIWDGLSAHWSHRMRAYLDSQRDWLCAERLPAYALRQPNPRNSITVLVSMGGCITSALTDWSGVEVVGAVLGTVSSRAGRGVGEMAPR